MSLKKKKRVKKKPKGRGGWRVREEEEEERKDYLKMQTKKSLRSAPLKLRRGEEGLSKQPPRSVKNGRWPLVPRNLPAAATR